MACTWPAVGCWASPWARCCGTRPGWSPRPWALLLVVPPLTNLLPGDWGDTVVRYFTSNAGQQISAVTQQDGVLSPWVGYGVFTLEWFGVLVIAALLLHRRDA